MFREAAYLVLYGKMSFGLLTLKQEGKVCQNHDAFVLSNVCILKWFAPPEKSVTLGYFVRKKKEVPEVQPELAQ